MNELLLALFAGISLRIAEVFSGKKGYTWAVVGFGAANGVILAYLTSHPLFAPVVLGIMAALLLSERTVILGHKIGLATAVLAMGIRGVPRIGPEMIPFFFAALADDEARNLARDGKIKGIVLQKFFLFGPALWLISLLYALLLSDWEVLIFSVLYDFGYFVFPEEGI